MDGSGMAILEAGLRVAFGVVLQRAWAARREPWRKTNIASSRSGGACDDRAHSRSSSAFICLHYEQHEDVTGKSAVSDID